MQRRAAKMDYSPALGRADLYPEQRVDVSGFKVEIDGRTWLVAETNYSITGGRGFITSLVRETSRTPGSGDLTSISIVNTPAQAPLKLAGLE